MTQRDPIQMLSCSLSKELFRKAVPQALARFPDVERKAFPKSLKDITLGEELEFAALILRTIDEVIRACQDAINKAPTLENIESIVLEGVSTRLRELGKKMEAERVTKDLKATFIEHPSLLDRISSAVLPPLDVEEKHMQQLERDLEQSVLKIVDHKERWESTAFALCEQGHILTAAHVFRKGNPLSVIFRHGDVRARKQVEVIVKDIHIVPEKDVAIVEVASKGDWGKLQEAGLRAPSLALGDAVSMQRGDPVLCLGYQAQPVQPEIRIIDPSPVRATIARHYPIRTIDFWEDRRTQACLVLIVTEGEERLGKGMSGGPVLNMRTGKVIAMITGAEQRGRIYQPLNREEDLPLAEYVFGVPLSDVAQSWPEFEKCCLRSYKP